MSETCDLDEETILAQWTPQPLTPKIDEEKYKNIIHPRVVSSRPAKYIRVDGNECLNLATNDYLGLASDPTLERAAIQALHKYGVGSCGPRGFYGTVDVHLHLEDKLAKFLNLEEAVLYSFGFSTVASAIPAYAKPNDVIFVDEQCNFAIQKGLTASRSTIKIFKHNDVNHLKLLLMEQNDWEKRNPKKAKNCVKFLVIEGIYSKIGDLCPLPDIMSLKKQFKVRLFIDESNSFGVLGSQGKGITQHFDNIDINDVDLIMASLENALCAYGGFCAGTSYIVDHQRLAGQAYCFSASLPPLQTQVASQALQVISENPDIIAKAHKIYLYAETALKRLTKLICRSSAESPIKHLILNLQKFNGFINLKDDDFSEYYDYMEKILDKICLEACKRHVALTVSHYIADEEVVRTMPSIRLIVNGLMGREDIDKTVNVLEEICTTFSNDGNKRI